MGRLGRIVAILSLTALLAGCGWNPGFGTGQNVGPHSSFGGQASGGGGQSGGGQGSGGVQGGGGGGQGGAPAGLPPGQERINHKIVFKGDVAVAFDTAVISGGGLELQGSARDESSDKDLARIDMIVRVFDSQGAYPGVGADLGQASVGSLRFRLGFAPPPRDPRYAVVLDGLRVIRAPQATFPLARNASLPAGGRIVSYQRDDQSGWVVRLIASSGVHYRAQLQWSDGRTFVPDSEQPANGSNAVTWDLHFSDTPSEGRPAALQIPEYTRDYLNLNQTVRA